MSKKTPIQKEVKCPNCEATEEQNNYRNVKKNHYYQCEKCKTKYNVILEEEPVKEQPKQEKEQQEPVKEQIKQEKEQQEPVKEQFKQEKEQQESVKEQFKQEKEQQEPVKEQLTKEEEKSLESFGNLLNCLDDNERIKIIRLAKKFSLSQVLEILETLHKTKLEFARAVSPLTTMEMCIVNLCLKENNSVSDTKSGQISEDMAAVFAKISKLEWAIKNADFQKAYANRPQNYMPPVNTPKTEQENLNANSEPPRQENLNANPEPPKQENLNNNPEPPRQENLNNNPEPPRQENLNNNPEPPKQENLNDNPKLPEQNSIVLEQVEDFYNFENPNKLEFAENNNNRSLSIFSQMKFNSNDILAKLENSTNLTDLKNLRAANVENGEYEYVSCWNEEYKNNGMTMFFGGFKAYRSLKENKIVIKMPSWSYATLHEAKKNSEESHEGDKIAEELKNITEFIYSVFGVYINNNTVIQVEIADEETSFQSNQVSQEIQSPADLRKEFDDDPNIHNFSAFEDI